VANLKNWSNFKFIIFFTMKHKFAGTTVQPIESFS